MTDLDLDTIAARLEGLEETIIQKLIDRAQFAANPVAYRAGGSGFQGSGLESLFDIRLRYQEEMDSAFGRFKVPEERPFHTDLPEPRRVVNLPDSPLAPIDLDLISCTRRIVRDYLAYLGELCLPGDDGQYGSSVEHDVLAIQAIARRVHFGILYVAESKYREDRAAFDELIDAGNNEGVVDLITRREVEERILGRVEEKVEYLQASVNTAVRTMIPASTVLKLYRDTIIPLTKEGEIRYLVARRPLP
jgi:chorismate mutase